jgi:hypothetical protein
MNFYKLNVYNFIGTETSVDWALKLIVLAGYQWLTPIILTMWEAEIGRIMVIG